MHAYQPCVVEVPDTSYPYRMWFFGWVTDIGNADVPGCDATYFARGKDLDHWEVLCKDGSWDAGKHNEQWVSVLHASPDADKHYYDSFHAGDPSVCCATASITWHTVPRRSPSQIPTVPSRLSRRCFPTWRSTAIPRE